MAGCGVVSRLAANFFFSYPNAENASASECLTIRFRFSQSVSASNCVCVCVWGASVALGFERHPLFTKH